jgi:iron complex transport system substrate-binding protein
MKIYLGLLVILVSACGNNKESQQKDNSTNEVKYANGFALYNKGNYYAVDVFNPWNNYEVLEKYIIADTLRDNVNSKGKYIRTPVNRAVFLSSTYIGMLSVLESSGVIAASSSANWIYDSTIYQKYLNGDIINLGNDLTINAEAIIGQAPDIVMKYIYQSPDAADDIIKSAGIPIVYNIEFMEKHPLGRAEWIKLMGLLTGKKQKADSIFSVIERDYNQYCTLAKSALTRPSVLVGNTYKGIWYAVGGNSFVAKLINDANAEYHWKSDSTSGSLPLSFEAVLQKQKDDDFWLNANASSLAEIMNIEPRCTKFKAFQTGKVYHYNKRVNPEGGLDYYESGVVRPDLLLHDLILILHPELFEAFEETIYWKKIE